MDHQIDNVPLSVGLHLSPSVDDIIADRHSPPKTIHQNRKNSLLSKQLIDDRIAESNKLMRRTYERPNTQFYSTMPLSISSSVSSRQFLSPPNRNRQFNQMAGSPVRTTLAS